MALKEKEAIYFDKLARTKKLETLLALGYAYYYENKQTDVIEALKYFFDIFKEGGKGTYTGDQLTQFQSQYTPALDFGLLRSGRNKELSPLGIKMVKGYISPQQFLSNVMLNYFQLIKGKGKNLLYEVLTFMQENNLSNIQKEELFDVFSENKSDKKIGEHINGLFHLIGDTLFFTKDESTLTLNPVFNLDFLIKNCNTEMYKNGFDFDKYKEQQKFSDFLTQETFILTEMYILNKKSLKEETNIKISGNYANRIIYGAPGTGKSHKLEEDSGIFKNGTVSTIERVTFYDGYTHGQFVGTYKPVPNHESITYKYIPGPFMKQLIKALKSPEDKFCLIIEEINRARADKVFGNIFQLLDRKNGVSQYPIAVSEDQAAYLESELSDGYYELLSTILSTGLYIPDNLYIWATMNSADQGVYALDSAFKRRWHFEHVGLDENEEKFFDEETIPGIIFQSFKKDGTIYYDAVPWNDFRHEINKRLLKSKVFEDRLIAPFFIKPTDFIRDSEQEYLEDNIYELEEDIFLDKVLMYLFEDVLKHKNKNTLFKSEYESFSELKKGYRNTDFDGLPNIHSIFIEDLRKDLEVISNKKNLSWNKEDAVNNSETEKQDN